MRARRAREAQQDAELLTLDNAHRIQMRDLTELHDQQELEQANTHQAELATLRADADAERVLAQEQFDDTIERMDLQFKRLPKTGR